MSTMRDTIVTYLQARSLLDKCKCAYEAANTVAEKVVTESALTAAERVESEALSAMKAAVAADVAINSAMGG